MMSSSILRQSLQLVDPEFNGRKKKRSDARKPLGQVKKGPNKLKKTKKGQAKERSDEEKLEEKIKLLQALSEPTLDPKITEKIIERAIKGRPLVQKIEVRQDKDEPILFTEESFKEFERKLFCS